MEDEIFVSLESEMFETKYRFHYKKEKLYLESFEKNNEVWQFCNMDPDFLYSLCSFDFKDVYNFSRMLNSIKPEIHNAVKNQTARKITLLMLLTHAPGLVDILKDSPVLGALLAESFANGHIGLQKAVELAYKPRHEIVRAVGGIGQKSEVRLILKFCEPEITDEVIDRAIKLLGNVEVLTYSGMMKLKFIDSDLAHILVSDTDLFRYPFVRNHVEKYYSSDDKKAFHAKDFWKEEYRDIERTYHDMKLMGEQYEIDELENVLLGCKTTESFYRIHSRWNTDIHKNLEELLIKKHKDISFCSPPIKGNDNIKPIENIVQLSREGVEMHNCVFSSYLNKVIAKECYFYSVYNPERATLCISMNKNQYEISNLLLACNKEPSNLTWKAVEEWFNKHYQILNPKPSIF